MEAREAPNRQTERTAAQPREREPENRKLNIVTGALSYTGHYIAEMLLANNQSVETVTNGKKGRRNLSTEPGPEATTDHNTGAGSTENQSLRIQSYHYNFRDPRKLVNALHGRDPLYNTYWVRLAQSPQEFTQAVRNSQILIKAAQEAGVRRFVHISAMNPQGTTELPYFQSKAIAEQHLKESRLSYAIIRPGLIFGQDDLFLNNLAWMIRRLPVLAIPGDGDYRIQPIKAHQFAAQVIPAGTETHDSVTDAAGPEVHTFNKLIELRSKHVQKKTKTIHLSHEKALTVNNLTGKLMLDIPLGPDESRTLA